MRSGSSGRPLRKEVTRAEPKSVVVIRVASRHPAFSHQNRGQTPGPYRGSHAGTLSPDVKGSRTSSLLEGLQFLAWLKSHRFAGRNGDLGTGSRIAPDTRLTWPNIENAEAAEFNPVTLGECFFHGLENGFHSHFGLGLGDAGTINYFIDDVEFDHKISRRIQRPRESR
jgi:hypothetical protein